MKKYINIKAIVKDIFKENNNELINEIRKLLNDVKYLETGKNKTTAFTRKRKMSLQMLIVLILKGSNHSLQIAIDNFFNAVTPNVMPISKQAYSKARTNIHWEFFKKIFDVTAKKLNESTELVLYNNTYRLIAVDGSTIPLDNSIELRDYFGCSGKTKDATTGLCSIAFDILNNIILDAELCPYKTNEREMATRHVKNISQHLANSIFIFDRGYPSKEFMSNLIDNNQKFLMRVREKFNTDINLIYKDSSIYIPHNHVVYKIRVLKVTLKSGAIETLLTNLSYDELPLSAASELYFMRWGVESKFDFLKNKLELENLSGKRVLTTLQDFWSKLIMANISISLKLLTDKTISIYHNPNNKYNQYTNQNRLVNKLNNCFLDLIFASDYQAFKSLMQNLIFDISIKPEDKKPDRTSPRNKARNRKHNSTGKTVL